MKKNKRLLLEIYITFLKLGAFSFGGGYAMIPLIERETVENKKWIEKEKLVDVFAVAESLPGAIALNSSAFVGFSIAKIPGAIAALLGNLTPSVIIVLTLNIIYEMVKTNPIVEQVFLGIRPAIIGLIAYAAFKIGKTAIIDYWGVLLAIIAFIASLHFHISPLILIILGALAGNLIVWFNHKILKKEGTLDAH